MIAKLLQGYILWNVAFCSEIGYCIDSYQTVLLHRKNIFIYSPFEGSLFAPMTYTILEQTLIRSFLLLICSACEGISSPGLQKIRVESFLLFSGFARAGLRANTDGAVLFSQLIYPACGSTANAVLSSGVCIMPRVQTLPWERVVNFVIRAQNKTSYLWEMLSIC